MWPICSSCCASTSSTDSSSSPATTPLVRHRSTQQPGNQLINVNAGTRTRRRA